MEAQSPSDGPSAAEREAVQELVRDLGRSLRVHLLYEGNNPAVDRFVDAVRTRMAGLWEGFQRLALHVEENEVLWEGVPVYRGETRSEDFAFLLYRDGVRELVFLPGFEDEELGVFLEILVRVQRLKADEDDLLTLLWDRDWQHLRYRYVEALPEGVALPEESGTRTRAIPPPREEESSLVSTVSRDDFREALYFLDEGDLRRLEAEVRREQERDLWKDVLSGLFDRLEDGAPDRQEQIVRILADLLPTLLASGNLPLAASLLRELVGIATRPGALSPQVLRAVRGLFERLSQGETVDELIRTVEEAPGAAALEGLGGLLSFFPPDALPALLRAAEATGVEGVRSSVLAAAERLAGREGERLVPLLAHEDPRIAAGAARVAGRRGFAAAAPEVARLLARPELPLRLVAVETLLALRNPVAAHALQGALGDAEREVRIAAARALAALRYTPARPALEAAIDSKRLREADLTERISFFEAFGSVAGEEGVALLDRMLNGKSWLGRKETPEMRACAALGLARSGLPAARRALASASADTDPVVRSAVGRALRGIES
jgi:HEAT repeat protein